MLRITQTSNARRAVQYFDESLSVGDYYLDQNAFLGVWGGSGCERLGLEGVVSRNDFDRLSYNRRPSDDSRLTARDHPARRVGYDFNFHCPKSVSFAWGLTGDTAILDAFQKAVDAAMRGAEALAFCQVRKAGKTEKRHVGELVWSKFIHFTSRPIDGTPDMHLHAHCFTFNAIFDADESQWKACEFGIIKQNAPRIESVFHATLGGELKRAGYTLSCHDRHWEIEGISRDVINAFSRRTTAIERVANEQGITDPKVKEQLGARTREPKNTALSIDELRSVWRARSGQDELENVDSIYAKAQSRRRELNALDYAVRERAYKVRNQHPVGEGDAKPSGNSVAARASVDWAMRHLFERASVVQREHLLNAAVVHGAGEFDRDDAQRALEERTDTVFDAASGGRWLTSDAVLGDERRVIDAVRGSLGRYSPVAKDPEAFENPALSKEQNDAMKHLLTSSDGVILLRGVAGTGKSTLMSQVLEQLRSSGYGVTAVAPTGEASRGAMRAMGVANADTLASFLTKGELQETGSRGSFIWLDEVGQVGTPTFNKFMEKARDLGARVILTGDERQHAPVERGNVIGLLKRFSGLRDVSLEDIKRQRGLYRSAVTALSQGDTSQGFEGLHRIGAIREMSEEEAHHAVAWSYANVEQTNQSRKPKQQKSVIAVSPTNDERGLVSEAIRSEMKRRDLLGKEGRSIDRLRPIHFTQAERELASSYEKGMVIRFHRNAGDFKAGQRVRVLGHDPFGNVLASGSETLIGALPLKRAGSFSVFERDELEVCPGETIRITGNGKTADGKHSLSNGVRYLVDGFTLGGDLKLSNGWVVDKHFGHVDHGYCVTSHASQGKTVDTVLISATSRSFAAVNAEQFYVSASRGRDDCQIYTDDLESLRERVTESSVKQNGVELQRDEELGRDRGRQAEWELGRE